MPRPRPRPHLHLAAWTKILQGWSRRQTRWMWVGCIVVATVGVVFWFFSNQALTHLTKLMLYSACGGWGTSWIWPNPKAVRLDFVRRLWGVGRGGRGSDVWLLLLHQQEMLSIFRWGGWTRRRVGRAGWVGIGFGERVQGSGRNIWINVIFGRWRRQSLLGTGSEGVHSYKQQQYFNLWKSFHFRCFVFTQEKINFFFFLRTCLDPDPHWLLYWILPSSINLTPSRKISLSSP